MNPRREVKPYAPPIVGRVTKPPARALPPSQSDPAPGADEPADPGHARPANPPPADQTVMVGIRLGPGDVAKLDRIRARVGGLVKATRPSALRWLLRSFDESTI